MPSVNQLSLFDEPPAPCELSDSATVAFCCELMRQSTDEIGFLSGPTVQRYVNDGGCLVHYDANGSPVAYLIHSPLRPGYVIHIHQVCVRRGQRGRGHGTALVERLTALAMQTGCRALRCVCASGIKAQGFWPRFGFKVVAEQQRNNRRQRSVNFLWLDLQETLFSADLSDWTHLSPENELTHE